MSTTTSNNINTTLAREEVRDWVVDVDNRSSKVNLCEECNHWDNQCIYMVPSCIKDLNPTAYKPTMASFGPYHHRDPNLLLMENHKHRALLHFINRAKCPIADFLNPMREALPAIMGAYERLDTEWTGDHDKFLKLMVMDGCFMLEILRHVTGTNVAGDYAANDPIFSHHGTLHTIPYIKRDMLMIENQIPLLVLQKLVDVESQSPVMQHEDHTDISRLVLKFFFPNQWSYPKFNVIGLHALDVYHKNLIQGPYRSSNKKNKKKSGAEGSDNNNIIMSAMELNEAGVVFKTSKTSSLKDITFKRGVLQLPVVMVDDTTESMFLNLMAYERLHVGVGNEVTSYVFFMDNIIDSAKDVNILEIRKIIHNALGSDKAVAKLFNNLSRDVTLDPDSSLDDVQRRVNKYCGKKWNMWRANLIHTYFRSPWALISLAAAIFLLGLTVVQTFYSVYPYYHPSEAGNNAPPLPPPRQH